MTAALLIPCYNAEAYLLKLSKQIAALDPSFDEVILANDASQDNTASVAEALGFRVIDLEKNLGPGGARNRLAGAAIAEWIHFLDCDDCISPTFMKDIAPALNDDADVVLCTGDFIDEENHTLLKRWAFDRSDFVIDAINASFRTPIPSFCSTIRRQHFLRVGGFDETKRCWEDGDLHLRLAVAGSRFRVIDEVLSISPRHSRGASANHLYCHQCRLEFIEGYVRNGVPIERKLLAKEAANLGHLFLSAGKRRSAWRAYSLIKEIGRFPAESNNLIFNAALKHLPLNWSHFLSATTKIGVGRLRDFKASRRPSK